MEKVVMVAENGQCSGSNLLPKSVDSSLKIDSITIDLVNANGKSRAEKCDHFSMRKYVSDVRKKNWKLCWPFASDGGGDKCDERECELPPIHIPEFRYWHCQSCLRDISAQDFETDRGITHRTSTSGFKSGTICSRASILQDDAVLVTDLQHLPDINFHKGKKIDANALTNTNNTSGYHPASHNGKNKDDKAVTDFLTLARNLVSDDYSNKEEHLLTTGLSSLIQTTYPVDGKANHKSKGKGSIDVCKTTFRQSEVANTEWGGDHSRVLKKAAINSKGKEVCAGNPQKELVAWDISGDHSNNTKAHKTSKGNVLESPEMDEFNNASSDSTEVLPGKNICHGSSSGLHRRKTRKVRLLTDLLSDKGNGNTNNIKVDDSQVNGIPDAYRAGGKPLNPQGQVIIHGNGRRVSGQHRKRKLDEDEDEDWRPLEIESPSKASKDVRILKRGSEPSETISQAFSRMQLQSATKNTCMILQSDGNPTLSKKKCKKAIVFEDLVPVPNELMGTGVKTGDASTSNSVDEVLPNPIPKADKGREADFFSLSSQRTDRKPNITKKNKILYVDHQQASSIPWNHMLGDLTAGKGAGFLHTQPAEISFHLTRDALSENGQNLSLNSYLTMSRCDIQHNPLLEGIDTPLLSWQKRAVREDQASNKAAGTNCVRNVSLASDMSAGKGIRSEMGTKGIANNIPLLVENQNYTSQAEIGSCSYMQPKSFGGGNSNKKAIEIQERPTIKRNNNDQRANRAPEQGNLDDIPMEIVELMAKHQYERRLPDAEHDRFQTINFNKAYGNREVSLFQQGATQKQNPRAIINRNGITNRGENLGPLKQQVDYFSQADGNQFTMSQMHQTPVPAGYEALFQHQEKPSSRMQHSGSSSGHQNIAQNSKWNEDSVGKRSCNSCMTIQQNRNTNHIWSSLMPNHIPFLHTAPQKCNSLPTNVDALPNSTIGVLKENASGDGELKFLDQNVGSSGKQNRNLGPKILGTYPEHQFSKKRNVIELNQKPVASLDLYANETIPAMHLLSLMDAGLRSSSPMDVNSEFLKRTSTAYDQDPKDFYRLDSGASKIPNAKKHASYDPCNKNQVADSSRRGVSIIPTVVGPSFYQQDKCFNKAIDFMQEKVKGKGIELREQNNGHKSQKSKSPVDNSGSTYCGSFPAHSMPAMFFGGSDSVKFSLQNSGMGNSSKNKLEAPSGTRPGRPPKSNSETLVCSVNRNPADFSAPDARNSYMISGKDLKLRRPAPLPNGYTSPRLNVQKRQKKISSTKEAQRNGKNVCIS